MSDPSVEQWREATRQSTGARLRAALEANTELAMEHAKCIVEIHRLKAVLKASNEAALKQINQRIQAEIERDSLRAEFERLTARIARQPGAYHLTDKGLAAIADGPKERGQDG